MQSLLDNVSETFNIPPDHIIHMGIKAFLEREIRLTELDISPFSVCFRYALIASIVAVSAMCVSLLLTFSKLSTLYSPGGILFQKAG